jgi:hypothetical protein
MKTLLALLLLLPSLSWGNIYYKQIPQFLEEGFEIVFFDSNTIVKRDETIEIIETYILQKKDELVTCYNTTYKEPLSYVNGLAVKCYPHINQAIEKFD